jgi:hypothetical protein
MELAIALKAASEEVKEKIFKNMSERAGEMLKEEGRLSTEYYQYHPGYGNQRGVNYRRPQRRRNHCLTKLKRDLNPCRRAFGCIIFPISR